MYHCAENTTMKVVSHRTNKQKINKLCIDETKSLTHSFLL